MAISGQDRWYKKREPYRDLHEREGAKGKELYVGVIAFQSIQIFQGLIVLTCNTFYFQSHYDHHAIFIPSPKEAQRRERGDNSK